jgi:hypothetical protein
MRISTQLNSVDNRRLFSKINFRSSRSNITPSSAVILTPILAYSFFENTAIVTKLTIKHKPEMCDFYLKCFSVYLTTYKKVTSEFYATKFQNSLHSSKNLFNSAYSYVLNEHGIRNTWEMQHI